MNTATPPATNGRYPGCSTAPPINTIAALRIDTEGAGYEAGSNTTYLMVDGVTQQQTFTGNLLAESNPEVLVGVSKYQGALYLRYLGEVDEVAIYDGPVSAATFSDRINIIEGIEFAYDANGNRTSTDDGASVTTYGYQPFSNRLDAIGGLTTPLDAAGNRIADAGGTRTYTYNGAGRLNAVLDNGVQTASYVHNALGQRTQKAVGGAIEDTHEMG